ncbi:putative ankyrin repeat-containing domain, PGG domain-containing protein [Rosa chinensis]|uniref:Putative ankyrin repeat-containing domain, PGG domain-containing protein n=1 Tax=Rosa chinensis TaxID=74649 RepID=A0A2P6S7R4_ROSCH|nr:putative ankyrin repeat-containing domain, PGG domain-containing protein [Rosa chinensis]
MQSMCGCPAHALVKALWRSVTTNEEFAELVKTPTHLLFDALKSGNSEFVTTLVHYYPALLWEKDSENHTIIHAAVSLRQANVCKLIHEIGLIKNVILALKDDRKNTMLHLAARLAPKSQLNKWSGAALRMQHELKWFEDVKRILPPSYIDMKNSDDQTAQEVFSSAHAELLKEAEKWMNDAAKSCMVVSSLLVSALFTTGITVALGGNNSSDHHLKRVSYQFFIISDAVALFMGLIATLMFFYILTSRYAEKDFLEDLPSKLLKGLIFLFISIIALMTTFSTVFFIAYGVKNALPYLVLLSAGVALVVFFKLLLPFGQEIRASTTSKSLFEPSHN